MRLISKNLPSFLYTLLIFTSQLTLAQIPPILIDPLGPTSIDPNSIQVASDKENSSNSAPQIDELRQAKLEQENKVLNDEEEKKNLLARTRQSKLPEAKIWGTKLIVWTACI